MVSNDFLIGFKKSIFSIFNSKFFAIAVIFNSFMILTIYLKSGSDNIENGKIYLQSFESKWNVPILNRFDRNLLSSSLGLSESIYDISSDNGFQKQLNQHMLMQSTKNGPWYMFNELQNRTKDNKHYFDIFPAMVQFDDVLNFEERNLENNFPIAFSHLIHKHFAVLEVFLSLYFRPNNFHCIHLDARSPEEVRNVISNLVKIYSRKRNKGAIFMIPLNESLSVGWGEASMLEADLKCIKKLLEFKENGKTAWRYLLSVAGTELPTRSYWKFHRKLSQTLGEHDSSVESQPVTSQFWSRFSEKQLSVRREVGVENGETLYEFDLVYNNATKTNISFQMFKGTRNVILSAKDAEFICYHPVSKFMYEWIIQAYVPDEHFYATIIRMQVDSDNQITQNKKGKIIKYHGGVNFTEGNTLNGICPRYTLWYCDGCHGECIRWICNLNRRDLEKIQEEETECLIVNKFNFEVDPSVVTFHLLNLISTISKEIFQNDNNKWYFLYIKKIANIMLE